MKNKTTNPLPKNLETAKNAPKGNPNRHEKSNEKKDTFKDKRIISIKSLLNEKIKLNEFLNMLVNSITKISLFFLYYKV